MTEIPEGDWVSEEAELLEEARFAQLDDAVLCDFEDGYRWEVVLQDRNTGKEITLRRNFSSSIAAHPFEEWMLRWQCQDDVVMVKRQYKMED